MQASVAHLNYGYGIHQEPKVSHETDVKAIALAAIGKIPGGKELVEKTFNKGPWKKPFTLPAKRHVNQAMHLGWG